MLYLISVFWFWLLLALLLGLAVGWFTFAREGKGSWAGIAPWVLALAAGALVSGLRLLPKGPGYWFDLAVLFFAAYLAGCLIAALVRARGTSAAAGMPAARAEPRFAPVPVAPPRELAVEPAAVKPAPAKAEAPEEAITGLSAPRDGKPDDLTAIYGIDAETQAKLNALGLYHYGQIASLTPGNRRWLFRHLGYEGRFPAWWWRWRYDAAQILAGKAPSPAATPLAVAAPMAGPAPHAGDAVKPGGISAPRDGKADDLKRIRGIGKQNEGRLHGLGIWHFDQIAAWSPGEVRWVGAFLAFPGRIEREDWVGQAAVLAKGGETDFSKRADAGEVETSRDESNDDGQGNVIPIETAAKTASKPAARKVARSPKPAKED